LVGCDFLDAANYVTATDIAFIEMGANTQGTISENHFIDDLAHSSYTTNGKDIILAASHLGYFGKNYHMGSPGAGKISNATPTVQHPMIYQNPQTFTAADATPSVAGGSAYQTHTGTLTITAFDNGCAGQEITIISKGPVTFDTTGTDIRGSTVDITTADGDLTRWYCVDGTIWRLIAFVDSSVDNSGGA
jgi:hypothetical protein